MTATKHVKHLWGLKLAVDNQGCQVASSRLCANKEPGVHTSYDVKWWEPYTPYHITM